MNNLAKTSVAALLPILLIAKDTLPLGERFILRGIAQGLCLALGLLWLLTNGSRLSVRRYWVIGVYFVILTLSAGVSALFGYVLLQVLSLFAVVVFAIAVSAEDGFPSRATDVLAGWAFVLYGLASLVSVLGYAKGWGWMYMFEGSGVRRFSGVFGMPAMLAAGAGVAAGLAMFGQRVIARIPIVLRALVAGAGVVCLFLTGSRTFWVAWVVAASATLFVYVRSRARVALVISGALALVGASLTVVDIDFSERQVQQAVRVESLHNLTGRLALWKDAIDAVEERPILGYGFSAGGLVLSGSRSLARANGKFEEELFGGQRRLGKSHNGYIQALIDSGVLGALLYAAVVFGALYRVTVHDKQRRLRGEYFVLVFLAVANLGESVILGGAVFHSVLFWVLAAGSMALRRNGIEQDKPGGRGAVRWMAR